MKINKFNRYTKRKPKTSHREFPCRCDLSFISKSTFKCKKCGRIQSEIRFSDKHGMLIKEDLDAI